MPKPRNGGSMWISLRRAGGIVAHVSMIGAAMSRKAPTISTASASPAITAPSIATIGRARSRSGTSGSGGSWRIRADVVAGLGAVRVHSSQRVDLGALAAVPDRDAGEHLVDRVERELEAGHGAEAPTAAAQRPEQLGLALAVDHPHAPVGRDDLDRQHAVGGQAVAAPEPAQPAAERVADHADVRRGARERGEPELGRRLRRDVHPQRARAHVGATTGGIDADAPQLGRPQQHGAVERPERRGVVAGALDDDA